MPIVKKKQNSILHMGFYKRKFIFFLLFFLVIIYGYNLIRSVGADTISLSTGNYSYEATLNIKVAADGSILVNDKSIKSKIALFSDFDELRLPVLDNQDNYFDKVTVNLSLPPGDIKAVKSEFLGIHGVESTKTTVSGDTIVYEANNVSPKATLTVVAKLPKGMVAPSVSMIIQQSFKSIKNSFWLILATVLPAITFLTMFFFLVYYRKRQKIDIPQQESSQPPMAIPPAIVGVLFNQKVSPREIAATLIDLALRGDIVILDHERDFAFGKGKFDQRLLGFEKLLLSKIFKNNMTSDRQEIERRINNHFYSKKISFVAAGVYALATRLGYFKTNPQKYHAKYRLVGIAFFLIALSGFALNILLFNDIPYTIFFWVGMMISALIIAFTAGALPIRTAIGQEVLSNWLAFKKFLSSSEPFPYSQNNQEVFQKYLPYAIVMNCEAAWAKRFVEHNFMMPEWFLTDKGSLGLEDFCLSLFPIVSYVGRSLSALREPGFE